MNPKLSVLSEVIRRRMYELNIRSIKALEDNAGVPRDTIRNVMSGRTQTIRTNKLEPIANVLRIEVSELIGTGAPTISHQSGDYTMVPRYDVRLTAGAGAFPDGEPVVEYVPFSGSWLNRTIPGDIGNLAVIEISGDSMEPLIRSGDEVLINLADTSLVDGGIFAITMNAILVIKRIFPSLDGVEIRSENPQHPSWQVKKMDMNDLKIVGRAVVRLGRLN